MNFCPAEREARYRVTHAKRALPALPSRGCCWSCIASPPCPHDPLARIHAHPGGVENWSVKREDGKHEECAQPRLMFHVSRLHVLKLPDAPAGDAAGRRSARLLHASA